MRMNKEEEGEVGVGEEESRRRPDFQKRNGKKRKKWEGEKVNRVRYGLPCFSPTISLIKIKSNLCI